MSDTIKKTLSEMTKEELIELIKEERVEREFAVKYAKIHSYSEGFGDAMDKNIERLKQAGIGK